MQRICHAMRERFTSDKDVRCAPETVDKGSVCLRSGVGDVGHLCGDGTVVLRVRISRLLDKISYSPCATAFPVVQRASNRAANGETFRCKQAVRRPHRQLVAPTAFERGKVLADTLFEATVLRQVGAVCEIGVGDSRVRRGRIPVLVTPEAGVRNVVVRMAVERYMHRFERICVIFDEYSKPLHVFRRTRHEQGTVRRTEVVLRVDD